MSADQRAAFAALAGQPPAEVFGQLATPCYILEESALLKNARILAEVAEKTGCRMLLAQKAFSNFNLYPVLAPYLAGTEASGLYEARLGAEEMPGKEVHVFCGAYREDEFEELLQYADHIVFNSIRQLEKFGPRAKAAGKEIGLRINPECSTQAGHAIYDPCAPGSRLGVTRAEWDSRMTGSVFSLLDGLHFHTLCEQDSDALEITLNAVEEKFADVLPRMKWLNCGGGHHVTRPGYDLPRLEHCLKKIRDQWGLQAYLEPGEAWALNAGYLASRVLDVVQNGDTAIAVLDSSAACHMPDVLEMPYTPPLYGAEEASEEEPTTAEGCSTDNPENTIFGEKPSFLRRACGAVRMRLAGPTCLAGDVIGDYYFEEPLQEGDLLLFGDMAIYTTCKNNTFNGMPLPSILVRKAGGNIEPLISFGYRDFRMRLGITISR